MNSWKASDYTRVYRIITGKVNTYLIQNEHCFILYNCGNEGAYDYLMDRLQACFVDPAEIQYIIVNDNYPGCKANLKKFRKQSDAKIISHYSIQIFRKIPPLKIGRQPEKTPHQIPGIAPYDAAHFFPHSQHITYQYKFNMAPLGINGYIFNVPEDESHNSSLSINNEIILCGNTLANVHNKSRKLLKNSKINSTLQIWNCFLATGASTFLPSNGKPVDRDFLREKHRTVSQHLHTQLQAIG